MSLAGWDVFLSTPSARRATINVMDYRGAIKFLSTPSARRATWHQYGASVHQSFLSTPSARRATVSTYADFDQAMAFLSTPSARRATSTELEDIARCVNFYPRPLRGGRQLTDAGKNLYYRFLSTPSARRATGGRADQFRGVQISIHALCEEGDRVIVSFNPQIRHFYPRPLRGGRLRPEAIAAGNDLFLSTPSARRATHDHSP